MAEKEELATAPLLPRGILHFPEGLPGFEDLTQFVVLQDEELLPIVFLTSLMEPKICLPAVPVQRVSQDYHLNLGEEDRRVLHFPEEPVLGRNALCLAIVNLGDGTQPATANLFAPIVVNLQDWTAKQVIQFDSSYSAVTEV